jgi:multisubunit Na+/H+ antiporter MnhF subunit
MSGWLTIAVTAALAAHGVMLAVCLWRVWRAEEAFDRLVAADLVGTLVLAGLVLVAVRTGNAIFIDVALGLAVLGFVGTAALARYLGESAG